MPAAASGARAIVPSIRIDKLLWYLRLAQSRSFAGQWVCEGHIRLNGRRIERPSAAVRAGDLLVLPMRGGVWVIELLLVPPRRGPAAEAQASYRRIDHADAAVQAQDLLPADLTGAGVRL